MKLQRFFGEFDFRNKEIETSNRELINQIKNVFRYQKGSEVLLLDGTGQEALVEIKKIDSEHLVFEIKNISENKNLPKNKVFLYCSIFKKENFELVVQKATEIGVSHIYPLLSARTLKQNIKEDRIIKIIKESSEQSERGTIPKLHPAIEFWKAIKNINKNDLNIMFDYSGQKISEIKNINDNKINIFIGPEGGWEDYEIESAKENDFKIVSLGKLNLRGETAAIVATYLATNI